MRNATTLKVIIMLVLLAGCASTPVPPPLVVSGRQPVQLARDRGYVACVTALHPALRETSQLWLHQRYRSKLDDEDDVRVFHLDASMLDRGGRRTVRFVCTTEPFGRTRVLSLSRAQRSLLD